MIAPSWCLCERVRARVPGTRTRYWYLCTPHSQQCAIRVQPAVYDSLRVFPIWITRLTAAVLLLVVSRRTQWSFVCSGFHGKRAGLSASTYSSFSCLRRSACTRGHQCTSHPRPQHTLPFPNPLCNLTVHLFSTQRLTTSDLS